MSVVSPDATAGASTPSSGTGANSLSWSHTVGGGAEKLLVVEILLDTTFSSQVQQVTFGGANLTRLQRGSSLSGQVLERWILMNPAGGVGTVNVKLPGTDIAAMIGFSRSVTNVDQQNPFGMPGKVDASGSFSTITNTFTVEGAAGDMALYWWGSDPAGFALGDGSEVTDATNLSVSTTTSGVVQRAAALRKSWAAGSTIEITNPSFSAVVSRAALLAVRLRASGNANTPVLGTKGIGGAYVTPSGGEIRVYRHYVASLVGLAALQVRVDGGGSTLTDSPHRMVIYNAGGIAGNPGSLVATSSEVIIPTGAAEAWVRFPFADTVYLPPGVYWIGFHDGATGNCIRIRTLDTQTFTGAFDNDAYAGGPNLVFVQPPTDKAFEPSIYAEGVASGGGGGASGATTAVLHPAAGQLVRGTIALGVQITTTIPVLGVQWKLDGATYGTEVLTAPWTRELDTTTLTNGSHTVQAVVRDANGTVTTALITFTVNNTLPSLGIAGTRISLPPRVRVQAAWPNDLTGLQYKDVVPGSGPFRWYRLAEANGAGGAVDASGNNANGVYTGSFTFGRTGPITGEPTDKAVLFGAGATVTVPGQTAMVNGMAVSMWFQLGAGPDPGLYPTLFRAQPNIVIAYLVDTRQVVVTGFESLVYGQFAYFSLGTPAGLVSNTAWNRLDVIYGDFDNWTVDPTTGRLVRSGSDGGGVLKSRPVSIYLNGKFAAEGVWPSSVFGDPLGDTSGAWSFGDSFNSGATLDMDELQVYEGVDVADLINQYNSAPNIAPSAAVYTDLTSRVTAISLRRGGEAEQGIASPGTASVYMNNNDRYLEPGYTGSADYPNVRVGKRVRILLGENYVSNPRAKTDLAGWSAFVNAGSGLAITRKVDEWIEPVGETSIEATATVTSGLSLLLYPPTTGANVKQVVPGDTVNLSAWVRAVTSNITSIQIRARYYSAGGSYLSDAIVATKTTTLTTWGRMSASVLIPAGVGYVGVSILYVGPNALMTGRATGFQIVTGTQQQQYVDEPTGFTGQIERMPQTRRSYRRGVVPLEATGVLSMLAQGKVKGTLPKQLPGARISRLLSAALWPLPDRLIDAGLRMLARETLTGEGEDAKTHAQQAAQSDLGVIFEDGLGRAVFHDGLHRSTVAGSAAPRMIVGDGGTLAGEYPFADIDDADSDIQTVENTIRGTRPGGSEVIQSDALSQRQYGPREGQTFVTKLDSQDDLAQIITARLAKRKDPRYLINGLTIDPLRHPDLWTHILSREISDRIMLHQRPQQVGSVSRIACYIEAIELRIELQEGTGIINARCVWRLSQP